MIGPSLHVHMPTITIPKSTSLSLTRSKSSASSSSTSSPSSPPSSLTRSLTRSPSKRTQAKTTCVNAYNLVRTHSLSRSHSHSQSNSNSTYTSPTRPRRTLSKRHSPRAAVEGPFTKPAELPLQSDYELEQELFRMPSYEMCWIESGVRESSRRYYCPDSFLRVREEAIREIYG
ncbi:hypothetical protein K402DRAFT_423433 [Aulographum hederae CBS 113979]|uniref:Uncharacterized protein n=1 Tax=Aulographum hederae CBS 113979 TaxID=1176131 RepID=A0A6G1GSV5_9PEZI|nr:hypothetical protein K402DRAFT_423433 [Aulographum hederae CBS 113979]